MVLETAEEAILALEKQDYDIIITDYRLPGVNGLDFARMVQRSHPQAIKILITAYGNEEVVAEAIRAGIDEVVEKPFTSETIERCLSRLIQIRA